MTIQLDPFQEESIEKIKAGHSVLVSAPTGAGKTLIAEYAIDQAISAGENVIYTAPIKALSNQKYRDFRARYGDDYVGILTGDVSINPDARILIMTTEIYRNCLFDHSARIDKIGCIIFDEIHYLDDPERGTVWEEAILFTPLQTRILALSATVPNVQQLADWIQSIHDRPISVVIHNERPVPLHFQFQCQGQILNHMKELRSQGYLNRESWRLTSREKRYGYRPMRAKPNRLDQLLKHLQENRNLPAIYFAFGRRRTEYLAREAAQFNFLTDEERTKIKETYQSLLVRHDFESEASAYELQDLIEHGIAYHHAGMLPTLKEIIEQLFTSRLIKVIFTTETFALGINMPARSVIFDELSKFYGTGFDFLTTRDFYQMAGRAGRRGMDEEGFVIIRINPQDIPFPEVGRVLFGQPEAIESQFNTTYATLLNLYRQLGRKELFRIYPKTFHYFQSYNKKRREDGANLIARKLDFLDELGYLAAESITPKGEFAASIFGYELLLSEMHEEGVLEDLDEMKLNILLSGLIFEPRKGDHLPRLRPYQAQIQRATEQYFRAIYKKEWKYKIHPYTKAPHFHLAPVVEAWTRGVVFSDLLSLTTTDEGELVRHFRMIIQLLRELQYAPRSSDRLRQMAASAREKINRGVVDAEKQLRA